MTFAWYLTRCGLALAGLAFAGCATVVGEGSRESPPVLTPTEQVDGQATSVTAEGQMKHEEECVPEAEANRVEAPSVEVGLSKNIAAGSPTQPYTRFKCR